MFLFLNLFKKKKEKNQKRKRHSASSQRKRSNEQVANRKGELGEFKIDIQLDQLPKGCRYLSDLLVKNQKAKSGYSQVDHVVLTPYGIFVIETKNYQGTIYGGKDRRTWLVNGKFKMMNPFVQNYGHLQALKAMLEEKYHNMFISMVSFTKRCTFKVGVDYRKIASDELIVYDVELSEFIHRKLNVLKIQHKEPLLTEQDITHIYERLREENITEPEIRERHTQALKKDGLKENTAPSSTCVVCKIPVSKKVKKYCLSNEKKFNGKIYCFKHQKVVQ